MLRLTTLSCFTIGLTLAIAALLRYGKRWRGWLLGYERLRRLTCEGCRRERVRHFHSIEEMRAFDNPASRPSSGSECKVRRGRK